MDPFVEKLFRYRQILRGDLPSPARRTVEWLLVTAIREHTGLNPYAAPWGEQPTPSLVTVANDALEQAVTLTEAQFGILQIYVSEQNALLMVAQRNFDADFLDQFACFTPDGRTSCSQALAARRRVIVGDVSNDDLFAPHASAALSAGFRAVQSTPLMSQSGDPIGMLSTHFASPRSFSNDELARIDAHVSDVSSELARAIG